MLRHLASLRRIVQVARVALFALAVVAGACRVGFNPFTSQSVTDQWPSLVLVLPGTVLLCTLFPALPALMAVVEVVGTARLLAVQQSLEAKAKLTTPHHAKPLRRPTVGEGGLESSINAIHADRDDLDMEFYDDPDHDEKGGEGDNAGREDGAEDGVAVAHQVVSPRHTRPRARAHTHTHAHTLTHT